MINEDELPGFLFLKIRGEIRGLLDGIARNVAVFRYGAKKETYTGQRNTGPFQGASLCFAVSTWRLVRMWMSSVSLPWLLWFVFEWYATTI
jgi:hypothetical protein